MKNQWLIAVIALLSVTACNQTVGECWPVGQGDGDTTVAGGPIVPGGAGGSLGNAPSGSGGTKFPEADCNSKPKEPAPPGTGAGNQDDQCAAGAAIVGGSATDGTTFAFCSGPCAAKCSVKGGPTGFSTSIFMFATTVADDGKGDAAGWQVATATLKFDRWISLLPEAWACQVTIGMPVRAEAYGKISPQQAAIITTEVANNASEFVMHNPEGLPPGIFCSKFKPTMQLLFDGQYKLLGAKMMK